MQLRSFLSMVAVISIATSLQASGKRRQTSSTPAPQYQKRLEFPTFADELPRFYLAKWK